MRELTIGHTVINDESDAYVIAEIGGNHRGSVEDAKAIIMQASVAGCSAVKFQKRDNRALFTPKAYAEPYNSENAWGPTYGEHREYLEFGMTEYRELKTYAESYGLGFIVTAFDLPSVAFLAELGVDAIKIASGDLRSTPLIAEAAIVGVPLIISTGGGTLRDMERLMSFLGDEGVAFLQCTASYPCDAGALNLRAIETYRERFPETVIGLSDHYDGIAMAPVAYSLGARIFEKHFTVDHTWKGSDQAFSLEPHGMATMVRDLKRTRLAMGDGIKRRMECEGSALDKMQKVYYPAEPLKAGTVLTPALLVMRSPGAPNGYPPCDLNKLIGRKLAVDLTEDDAITPGVVS